MDFADSDIADVLRALFGNNDTSSTTTTTTPTTPTWPWASGTTSEEQIIATETVTVSTVKLVTTITENIVNTTLLDMLSNSVNDTRNATQSEKGTFPLVIATHIVLTILVLSLLAAVSLIILLGYCCCHKQSCLHYYASYCCYLLVSPFRRYGNSCRSCNSSADCHCGEYTHYDNFDAVSTGSGYRRPVRILEMRSFWHKNTSTSEFSDEAVSTDEAGPYADKVEQPILKATVEQEKDGQPEDEADHAVKEAIRRDVNDREAAKALVKKQAKAGKSAKQVAQILPSITEAVIEHETPIRKDEKNKKKAKMPNNLDQISPVNEELDRVLREVQRKDRELYNHLTTKVLKPDIEVVL